MVIIGTVIKQFNDNFAQLRVAAASSVSTGSTTASCRAASRDSANQRTASWRAAN